MRKMAEYRNYDNPNATTNAQDKGESNSNVRNIIREGEI